MNSADTDVTQTQKPKSKKFLVQRCVLIDPNSWVKRAQINSLPGLLRPEPVTQFTKIID